MFPRQAAVDPKSMLGRASDKITIIHFNDVADTEARDSEPCGGAARCKYFQTEISSSIKTPHCICNSIYLVILIL